MAARWQDRAIPPTSRRSTTRRATRRRSTAQRDELLRLATRRARGEGATATAIPFLSLLRSSRPTAMRHGILEPSFCVVLQGDKRIHCGRETRRYGAGSYVMSALEYPTAGQIARASAARPYLAVRIVFEVREIAEVIVDGALVPGRAARAAPAVFVGVADARVIGCLLRLLQLLDEPDAGAYLAGAARRELIYRLLRTEDGPRIYRSVRPANLGIGRAVDWLRRHFDQPIEIVALAKASRMSVSSLRHELQAATALAPLQFQKQLRLQEARRLMLAGGVDAGTAAFRVGYESASQFSREYRRMFGAPPLRDIRQLAGVPAEM